MVGGLAGVVNKIEKDSPEYMALNCVVSDEQADVALTMGLRKPRTAEYVSQKCGKSLEETHKILMELADIGVCKVWHEDGQELFWSTTVPSWKPTRKSATPLKNTPGSGSPP